MEGREGRGRNMEERKEEIFILPAQFFYKSKTFRKKVF